MEVKILCPCGAKYKFDVEPLNGKLPGPVSCPVCQADGTHLGNQVIAQALGATQTPTPMPVQAAPSGGIRIGAPAAQPAVQTAVPTSSGGGRSGFVAPSVPRSSKEMRAASDAPTQSPAPIAITPAMVPVQAAPAAQNAVRPVVVPVAASAGAAPNASAPRLSVSAVHAVQSAPATVAVPGRSAPPVPAVAPGRPQKMEAAPSFMRGLIGIAAAAFIALLVWFGITLSTGFIIKPLAIGIGVFIGWAGAWLAKEKTARLGVAAATATALAVIIGLMWSARHEAYSAVNETIDEMWQEQLEYAKGAVQAARTDATLLKFLNENGTGVSFDEDEDEEEFERSVTRALADEGDPQEDAKMLSDFRKNELPKLRKFADGKVSKSQFDREHRGPLEAIFTIGYMIGETFRIKVIVWIGLAIGAAWKLTSGQ